MLFARLPKHHTPGIVFPIVQLRFRQWFPLSNCSLYIKINTDRAVAIYGDPISRRQEASRDESSQTLPTQVSRKLFPREFRTRARLAQIWRVKEGC